MAVAAKEYFKPTTLGLFTWAFCLLLAMAFMQYLFLPNIDHDEMEAVRWGAEHSWLHDRHPPLLGFIGYNFARLTQYSDFAFFILSKINALVGLSVMYWMSREFVPHRSALLATACYACTYPFIVQMLQLDANSILLAVWPAIVLFFWRAYSANSLFNWVLLGVCASLGMLGKYHTALLLLVLFGYLLAEKRGRMLLLRPGPWLALIAMVICLAPHLLAHWENGFQTLIGLSGDISGRGQDIGRWSIFNWMLDQVAYGAIGMYALAVYLRVWKRPKIVISEKERFLIATGVVFPLLPLVISLLGDVTLRLNWGINAWLVLPTMLLAIWQRQPLTETRKLWAWMLAGVPVYFTIFTVVNVAKLTFTIDPDRPSAVLIKEVDKWWDSEFNQPFAMVATNERPAQGFAFYGQSKPVTTYWYSIDKYSWLIDENGCMPGPVLGVVDPDRPSGAAYMDQLESLIGPADKFETISVPAGQFRLAPTRAMSFRVAAWSKTPCLLKR